MYTVVISESFFFPFFSFLVAAVRGEVAIGSGEGRGGVGVGKRVGGLRVRACWSCTISLLPCVWCAPVRSKISVGGRRPQVLVEATPAKGSCRDDTRMLL